MTRKFFCKGHLEDLPVKVQSSTDSRYCIDCQKVIDEEAELVLAKRKWNAKEEEDTEPEKVIVKVTKKIIKKKVTKKIKNKVVKKKHTKRQRGRK